MRRTKKLYLECPARTKPPDRKTFPRFMHGLPLLQGINSTVNPAVVTKGGIRKSWKTSFEIKCSNLHVAWDESHARCATDSVGIPWKCMYKNLKYYWFPSSTAKRRRTIRIHRQWEEPKLMPY